MQKLNNTKKVVGKNLLTACVIGILLSTPMVSIAGNTATQQTNCGDLHLIQPKTYYNATLFIITNLYYVRHFDDEKIDLSYRYPYLPGIFIIKDENGIQERNLGGWCGTRAEIYGFNGFFKWQGLYTVLIGNCARISIIPVR